MDERKLKEIKGKERMAFNNKKKEIEKRDP